MERLLHDARSGRSGVVAVIGEPGMGKSTLLGRAVERARGMRVLRAQGVQSEAHIPFAGLADLLRPALYLLDRLPGPQTEALQGALALVPARAQDRFAIGSATLSLLVAYAEQGPVMVVVDDSQWIDGSSADGLSFAFRRLVADPVAVLVAARAGAPSPLASAAPERVDLAGLDLPASSQLVKDVAGPVSEDLLSRLHRETGGNPLALIEAARQVESMQAAGPLDTPLPVQTSVAQIYLDRIRSVPPDTATVLLLAASSDLTEPQVLARGARALGVDIADLGPAEDAGLVSVGGDAVTFSHPLIRAAVYHDASPERRRRAHRALAGVLPDRQADRRAWHLALAALGPDGPASSALEQAGERALDRNAYEVASRAFERAGQLAVADDRRGELLYRAARAAWDAGLPDRAVQLVDRAGPLPVAEPVSIALEHLRGQIATRRGPVSSGLADLLRAATRCAPTSPDQAAMILAEAVNAAFYAGDTPTMLTVTDTIESLQSRVSAGRPAFFAAMAAGMAHTFSGRTGAGAEHLHRAMEIAATVVAPEDADWQAWTALCNLWLRESGPRQALVERAAGVARSRTALGVLLYFLNYQAIDQAATDRWTEAEAGFHQVITLARETGQLTDLAAALSRLAWLEGRQGREEECAVHAEESLSISRDLGLRLFEIWALAALGEMHLAQGRDDRAAECFTAQQRLLDEGGIADVDLSPGPELVELHLRGGATAEAQETAELYQKQAADKGLPWALARAARARGLLAPQAAMVPVFEEALLAHGQTPDRFETARTLLVYGARLRRAGQRVLAREQLRSAAEGFEYLGADPWAATARHELAATGEKARARSVATRNDLTPQELQIAILLCSGRTTREAASALFLSPKTIEYHLRNAYRKLECRNREELAGALSRMHVAGTPG